MLTAERRRWREAGQGLKALTGFTTKFVLPEVENDKDFANELNTFYARFDDQNFENECNILMNLLQEMRDKRDVFSEKEVHTALGKIKTRKATGPAGLKCL